MGMYAALLAWLPSPAQHFLFSALAVLAYVITTRARREPRAPTTAIAWVMGLALLPYLILPMYLCSAGARCARRSCHGRGARWRRRIGRRT
jgi:hypothetical protein